MTGSPVFDFHKISFAYGRQAALFKDMSFRIHSGESVAVLGANGSGKSTLLKIMCGLCCPQSGSFKAFDRIITGADLEDDSFSKQYHARVGFLFQNTQVQMLTTRVWDEIAYGPLQLPLSRSEIQRRVDDVLTFLEIGHLRDRSPYRLSGGEQKKVALASVLVLNPQVLIFDEPTNGLDPRTQSWLVSTLLKLNEQGRTLVIATHNLELAHTLCSRSLLLSEQHQIIFDGPTDHILNNHDMLHEANLIDDFYHTHHNHIHTHRYTHQ
jgi:cobalt/nickel transport system ATP-binding protein